jgi:hypothetical protein
MSLTNLKLPLDPGRRGKRPVRTRVHVGVVADLEGILKFIAKRDPVLVAITRVHEAVQILARHPLVDARHRELIILKGRTPYVAWYGRLEALRRHWSSGPVSRVSGSLGRPPEIDAP